MTVEGVVVSEPDVRDTYTNLRIEADRPIITDQPTRTIKGLALVQAPPFTDFRYGDRVRAEGKLETPVKGLYLCSSSTPPDGGLHGMGGYYAAQVALKKLLTDQVSCLRVCVFSGILGIRVLPEPGRALILSLPTFFLKHFCCIARKCK